MDADHVEGSYQAVRHLQEEGYRKIAFLNGSPQYSNSGIDFMAIMKAMHEAGLEVTPELLLEGNYSRKSGYEAASRLWEHRDQVEAVFAANDRMAIGLMQGLRERGWMAGRDFAIIGCDDSDAAKLSDPPLSSINVPFYEMGKEAARSVLAGLLHGEGSRGYTNQAANPFGCSTIIKEQSS